MAFPAKFPGRCAAECGEPIREGDLVRYDEDQIVHEECIVKEERPKEICPRCWTEIPCFCEE